MKLATLKAGGRDGTLVVVRRDLSQCLAVPQIAPTLQAALDDWERCAALLQAMSDALNAGWNGEMIGPESSADVIYEHLYRRAATIYGGSSEVQKNIIAKGALGL